MQETQLSIKPTRPFNRLGYLDAVMIRPKASSKTTRRDREIKSNNKNSTKLDAVRPSDERHSNNPKIPIELQQLLMNIFKDSFPSSLSESLTQPLQEVKQHLYNRDFHKAFGTERYREIYALRWSPPRALSYLIIFEDLLGHLLVPQNILQESQALVPIVDHTRKRHVDENTESSLEDNQLGAQSLVTDRPFRVLCLGGGAGAEVIALAGLLKHLQSTNSSSEPVSSNATAGYSVLNNGTGLARIAVTVVDIADWSVVVKELHKGLTTAPPLPKYASALAKATNQALVSEVAFSVSFQQRDVLNLRSDKTNWLPGDANLVTLMFTLNELYSNSIARTTELLLTLTARLAPGTLLLVVDSPSSYSTVSLGTSADTSDTSQETKKYPMQWLLDHTLLEKSRTLGDKNVTNDQQLWERLVSNESQWFRVPEGLKYPVELENMRYQIHLYRHL
ncbi:MAG: hypothetical protein M1812_004608 [Candelaria pacifica]|nr:MAG: hypothetical protein M1812_004608 [Candelaria pacifica]